VTEQDTIAGESQQEEQAAGEVKEAEPGVSPEREVAAPADELAAALAELDKVKAQAAEYLDGWQRARAELANARKRFEKERNEAGQQANGVLIRKMLPVLDDLERAIKTIPDDLRQNVWVDGITLIHRKFSAILESEGVKPIEVKPGDQFDPVLHEAVTHEENENHQAGAIIAEVQKGYLFGDQVLRPTLVRVAK